MLLTIFSVLFMGIILIPVQLNINLFIDIFFKSQVKNWVKIPSQIRKPFKINDRNFIKLVLKMK